MKNSNEECYHHLETLYDKTEKFFLPSNKFSKPPIPSFPTEEKQEKIFISLPENVIKTRIRSTVLELLLEKIENKDPENWFLTPNEINENENITELLKVEPNAKTFFEICVKEIIAQGFLVKKTDVETDFYMIQEKIWKDFFDFMKRKIKGFVEFFKRVLEKNFNEFRE